jgi:hypothetical protein
VSPRHGAPGECKNAASDGPVTLLVTWPPNASGPKTNSGALPWNLLCLKRMMLIVVCRDISGADGPKLASWQAGTLKRPMCVRARACVHPAAGHRSPVSGFCDAASHSGNLKRGTCSRPVAGNAALPRFKLKFESGAPRPGARASCP